MLRRVKIPGEGGHGSLWIIKRRGNYYPCVSLKNALIGAFSIPLLRLSSQEELAAAYKKGQLSGENEKHGARGPS